MFATDLQMRLKIIWLLHVNFDTGHRHCVQYVNLGSENIRLIQKEKLFHINIQEHWGPVHTYPDIFQPATFSFRIRDGFRPHASGEFDSNYGYCSIRSPLWKKKFATNPITCGLVNPDIFESIGIRVDLA